MTTKQKQHKTETPKFLKVGFEKGDVRKFTSKKQTTIKKWKGKKIKTENT